MMLAATRPTAANSLFSGSKSTAYADAEAEVAQAKAALDGFKSRLADTDHLLSLSRRERVQKCSTEVGRAMWNEKAKFHSAVAANLCIFSMGGLGCAAMLTGLNPLLGLAGGVGLTYGYLMAMKHVIFPLQIDRKVKPALEQEKRALSAAVASSQTRLEAARANLLKGIQSTLQGANAPILVSEAAVTVGGVRIKVRK